MHPRATELIQELDLAPHPEGGYFREIFRSAQQVQPLDPRPPRSALTTIYFLLISGQHSRWHRVLSDEVWHFYEGDPLDIFWIDSGKVLHRDRLSSGARGAQPTCVVAAGCWQAARPLGAYSLVGCTVGPGFEFADFEMITDAAPAWAWIRRLPGVPSGLR